MKNKKGRKNKIKSDPADYEGYQYGPIRLERFGREVRMSFTPEKHDPIKFNKRVLENRPKHQEQINKEIQQIINSLKSKNPLQLLSLVSIKNLFVDPEVYTESTFEGKETCVEYINSLALAISEYNFENVDDKFDTKEFLKSLEEIFNDTIWYFASELSEGKLEPHLYEIRFVTISRFLMIRGESYKEHYYDLLKNIFSPISDYLEKNFGFNFDTIWNSILEIERQVAKNVNNIGKQIFILHQLHERFKEFIKEENVKYDPTDEDLKQKFRALPDVQEKEDELLKIKKEILEIPFELIINDKLDINFLEKISATFGDNNDFLTFAKSPGWPTNNTIVNEKPIIKYKNKYYAFAFILLNRRLRYIIESWIFDKTPAYYNNVYQKKRSSLLEKKALEYLSNLLPNCKAYNNLFYHFPDDKENKFECDGLVFYDCNIFILEAKSGSLSLSARRGGLKSLLDELNQIIDSAYEQSIRTKKYITEIETPIFYDQDGNTILTINNKSQIRNIFLINITLEDMNPFSSRLHYVKDLNLVKGKEWPWSIFINDLRIISEIFDSPSLFLLYLQRRIEANDYPQFRAFDEMDFMMWFLKEGLYFKEMDFKNTVSLSPTGYTEELDRYYDFLGGRVTSGNKPRFSLPNDYVELILKIEKFKKSLFSIVTTRLLGVSGEAANDILNKLEDLKKLVKKDGYEHNITLFFSDFGLTISVLPIKKIDWSRIDDYCYIKMYQLKKETWIFLFITLEDSDIQIYDFKVYEKSWEKDVELDKKLKEFKMNRWKVYYHQQNKVGRNDPCPCGSGLKYKNCCSLQQ